MYMVVVHLEVVIVNIWKLLEEELQLDTSCFEVSWCSGRSTLKLE